MQKKKDLLLSEDDLFYFCLEMSRYITQTQ